MGRCITGRVGKWGMTPDRSCRYIDVVQTMNHFTNIRAVLTIFTTENEARLKLLLYVRLNHLAL